VTAEGQVPEGVDLETGEVLDPPQTEPEPVQPDEEPETQPVDDDPDQDEGVEPEGELSSEQIDKLQAQAEKDAAKLREKLDREAERHRTRLAEILQEDILTLVPCELCRADLAGWVETQVPLPDEVKQRVRIQIGDREPENWQKDTHSERCSVCDGMGEVETGSRVNGQQVMPCVECGGKGWVATDEKRAGFRAPVFTPVAPSAPQDEGNGTVVNHPALSTEDQGEIDRLRKKGIVVIVPQPA
jgi:hypothetical protein